MTSKYKKYLDINVYEAARRRTRKIFEDFERVYFSFSGGKDSAVMLHIAIDVAREMGRLPVHAVLIDLEGQYKTTMDFAARIFSRPEVHGYWVCLPIHLRNAVSVYQSQWVCWDPAQKDKWIRPMPDHPTVISDPSYFPFFKHGMEFEQFVPAFGEWFTEGKLTACGVGIRSDESLNRFRTIINKKKIRHGDLGWTTRVAENLYNFYPVYDWKTEDVWIATAKFGWDYNELYDLMHMQGRTIHEMRICQPYGDDQKKGLDLFHACEPETWFRVVNRVPGANMGAIYRGDNLLGNYKVVLPEGHTWKSYTKFLLLSLPRYETEHYMKKLRVFFRWWSQHGYPSETVPDEADPKLEAKRKIPSWRRVVKCLMKNDRLCKSLSFAQTKYQFKDYVELHRKYTVDGVSTAAIHDDGDDDDGGILGD